ncbi:MAG: hypothetical protein IIV81_02485, partial [Clostridia bacterium]|nr:hypothetical protein [Clostridia bacterium]
MLFQGLQVFYYIRRELGVVIIFYFNVYDLLSCGTYSVNRCVFCREGLIQLEYMQKEITQARGKSNFADLTKEIGEAMCYNTLCTVGQVSAKIALSAFEKFGGEFDAHIKKN